MTTTVDLISLEEAADLIEVSQVAHHDDRPSSVRLDLDHPQHGRITTIQAGEDVFLIRNTEAGMPAR